MKKVSIIIPVYNSEKYVAKCIKSLLEQTYDSIEVILVNDGSTDSSQKILDEYKEKYPDKIKVYRQENKGISGARNTGIDNATGEYIMFVDNDDYIKKDYIETFVKKAEEDNADIVIGGYERVNIKGEVIERRVLKNDDYAKFLIITPWARIYRRGMIEKNNIRFAETKIGEDIYINLIAYSASEKVSVIDYYGYCWLYNDTSISNTLHKGFKKEADPIPMIEKLMEKIKDNIDEEEKKKYDYFYTKFVIWYLLYSGKTATKGEFVKETNRIFDWLDRNISNYRTNRYLKKKPKSESTTTWLSVKVLILIKRLNMISVFASIYAK